MRLERLNGDKIKIFLTFDDLKERGITKEDMWHDLPRVEKLFRDMMLEADDELGFEASGPIDVEVFSLPAQGMVVIVSRGRDGHHEDDEFEDDDDFIQMQVTLDESQDVLYQFEQFEDVISLTKTLYDLDIRTGSLFLFENKYYIHFDENQLSDEHDLETLVAILAEYGNTSTITIYRIEEYGKCLIKGKAISEIYRYFIDTPQS
ncbi:genetic competence negative regulator [Sporolactobacillus kofuensis]|uniref:Adapter protein MecA n=1 Tax=Sporolactobacillus kofuensis TaxID=269672 RepID=A0ABW1WGC0_9BACL|nr:genetic competence negative regulator [Sporolactobacillus kofuensis]MCO7176617.1 genetic competence negative regulator [Sporolactobacillus kofuensis]